MIVTALLLTTALCALQAAEEPRAADATLARRLAVLEQKVEEERHLWAREMRLLMQRVDTLQAHVARLENAIASRLRPVRQSQAGAVNDNDNSNAWQPSINQLNERVREMGSELTVLTNKVEAQYRSTLNDDVVRKLGTLNYTLDTEIVDLRSDVSVLQEGMATISSDLRAVKREMGQAEQHVAQATSSMHQIKTGVANMLQAMTNDVRDITSKIDQDVSALSSRIDAEVLTLNSKFSMTTTALTQKIYGQVQILENSNAAQDQAIREAATSLFVRWGRSVCPGSAQLVYSGLVGGGLFSKKGSAPDVLCLPKNPVLEDMDMPYLYSEVYGAEYQTTSAGSDNRDPVCAVCRTPHPTTVMVPATNVCESGWTLEYSGYLMGGSPNHPSGHSFVCVDSAFESRPNSDSNDDGLLLFFTFTKCGSLPCPRYRDRKAVTCVVCSK